jgi:O-antigen/teichoic acid export membrane protein
MSQARAVLRNTAVLGTARLIERSGNLVLALMISRQLGASGLGVYATAIAYYSLIALAAESGSTNLLVREIAKDKSQTNAYLVHASVMAGGLALAITAVGGAVVLHLGYSADLRRSLLIVLLALVPGTLNTIQEAVFVANQRVEFETISTFGATLVLIGASAVLLARGYGVVPLVIAFVVVEYVVTIVYFVLINRCIARIRFAVSRAFARSLLHEVRAFAGSSLLAAALARPEIILLSFVATEAQVGYYSAALKIADLWQFVPSVYMINVFPVLSRAFHQRTGRAQEIQDRSIKYLLAFGLPVAAGMSFAAGPIIRTFYGDGFEASIVVLKILAVNVVIYCVNSVLWRVLAARGEQAAVLRAQVLVAGFRLLVGYALIVWLAETGAAITMVLALILLVSSLSAQVRRRGGSVHIVRHAWRFAVAAAIIGAVTILLESRLALSVLIVLVSVVYVALLVLLRAFSQDERAAVRQLLAGRLVRT